MGRDAEADSLIAAIVAAFAHRPYPGDDRITREAIGHPDHEANVVADVFRGKRWNEMTWDAITGAAKGRPFDPQGFIFLFTPEAFAYYLPAFLTELIAHERPPELAESLLFALSQEASTDLDERRWAEARMALLNDQERVVVARARRSIAARFGLDQ
jgi:hypothetical protein